MILALLLLLATPPEHTAYVSICEIAAENALQTRQGEEYRRTVDYYAAAGGLTMEQRRDLYYTCDAYLKGIQFAVSRGRRSQETPVTEPE